MSSNGGCCHPKASSAQRTTWITNWPGCDEDEIKLYHRQTQYGEIITHTPRASERDRRCNERRDTFHTRLLFTAGPLLCCIIICWLCALNLLCSSEHSASPSAACYYTRAVCLYVCLYPWIIHMYKAEQTILPVHWCLTPIAPLLMQITSHNACYISRCFIS